MIRRWLRRHPLRGFFSLAFGISWGGIVVILSARGVDLSPLQPIEGGLLFLMMLLGPGISGLTCTALLDGRDGLRALWQSAMHWRVSRALVAFALLTIPAILLAILLTFATLAGPAFLPRFQWPLLAVGIIAGVCEEIGWTGFATPRLLARNGPGKAGLTLGLIWAFWHLPVDFRYNAGAMGFVWPIEFAIVYLATLTPWRMLMTWVFSRTQSLGLAILMHVSFTGWLLVMFPATTPLQNLVWQAVFAATLWALVAGVLARQGARRPTLGE